MEPSFKYLRQDFGVNLRFQDYFNAKMLDMEQKVSKKVKNKQIGAWGEETQLNTMKNVVLEFLV